MSLSFKKNYVSHEKFQWDFSLSSNPFGPSPKVKDALMKALFNHNSLSPYPDAGYQELKNSIGSFHDIPQEDIFLGAGLDGLIFDIINLLLQPQDELILPTVTFRNAMYPAIHKGAIVTQIPMKSNLGVDFDQLIQAINAKTKIIFLCNPNNPTGIYEPLESIKQLLDSTDALVILDEANIEFSKGSGLELIHLYPNLIILKTFSKAYGLAGIRVGYGISKSLHLKKLISARPPFFISTLSEIASSHALTDQTYLKNTVNLIIQERNFLETELKNLNFTITPSESNTLLCRIPDNILSASYVIEQLHVYNCHVINGTYFNLEDRYLRIAPKKHEDNEVLIKILKSIL